MNGAVLRGDEAVQLAQAQLAFEAERMGVRLLTIKGASASLHRLREPRTSADVDLLLAPADVERFARRMRELGWEERPSTLASEVFSTHSITFWREGWPVNVDLHLRYPGFLARPEVIFDALWVERVTMVTAGIVCRVPGVRGAVAILALHSLRAMHFELRPEAEYRELIRRIREGIVEVDIEELASFAAATGSRATLQPLFADLGHPVQVPAWELRAKDYAAWMLVATKRERNPHLWIVALLDRPWRERPKFAARIIWPSRHDMLINNPGLADDSRSLLQARWQRLIGSAKAIPASAVALFGWLSSARRAGRRGDPAP